MMLLRRLLRAEYLWQPAQPIRRVWRVLRQPSPPQTVVVRLPWNLPLAIDPHELIGRSILVLNALDLPVTESIWRLLDPGETCADVGANIGYMTSVMAARLRAGGCILAFEPVPSLAEALEDNARAWVRHSAATLRVERLALGTSSGPVTFHLGEDFSRNRGTGALAPPAGTPRAGSAPHTTLTVASARLAEVVDPARPPALIKVDVEGGEAGVFAGAAGLLENRRIRDIIFEENHPSGSRAIAMLERFGYTVFRIARGWTGPRLCPADVIPPGELDPPAFLGTSAPDRAVARFQRRGWQSLRGSLPDGLNT